MKAERVCSPGSTFGTVMLPEKDPLDGELGTDAVTAVPLSMENVAAAPWGNPEPVTGICCPTEPWVCASDTAGRREKVADAVSPKLSVMAMVLFPEELLAGVGVAEAGTTKEQVKPRSGNVPFSAAQVVPVWAGGNMPEGSGPLCISSGRLWPLNVAETESALKLIPTPLMATWLPTVLDTGLRASEATTVNVARS